MVDSLPPQPNLLSAVQEVMRLGRGLAVVVCHRRSPATCPTRSPLPTTPARSTAPHKKTREVKTRGLSQSNACLSYVRPPTFEPWIRNTTRRGCRTRYRSNEKDRRDVYGLWGGVRRRSLAEWQDPSDRSPRRLSLWGHDVRGPRGRKRPSREVNRFRLCRNTGEHRSDAHLTRTRGYPLVLPAPRARRSARPTT